MFPSSNQIWLFKNHFLGMLKTFAFQPTLHHWQFVGIFAAYNGLMFQRATFSYAINHLDLTTIDSWLTLTALLVLLVFLMIGLLGLSLLISEKLLKCLAICLLIASSTSSYFMHAYKIVLDVSMMGNVLNTQIDEAVALLNADLFIWVGFFGLIPSWWIWRLSFQCCPYWKKVLQLALALTACAVWLYLNAPSWLWLDRHMSRIGSMTPPWSYLVNSIRYLDRERLNQQPQITLVDLDSERNPGKRAVVLVIGESARSANFSLYGYNRLTNPKLGELPIEVFRARACATYTTASLACILSHRGQSVDRYPPEEVLPTYLQRQGVDVQWRSNNFGEPRMFIESRVKNADLLNRCLDSTISKLDQSICDLPRAGAFDAALLLGLERRIESSNSSLVFIVIHQAGSHGPAYFEKYPASQTWFTPDCRTVNLHNCTTTMLVNAYDNSIRHTDSLLAEIIARLSSLKEWDSMMIYVSDHGESLGESGLYLHGAPSTIAPNVQMEIPFLVWRSSRNQGTYGQTMKPILRDGVFSHDHVFHTVIGALGLRGGVYREEKDLVKGVSY